MPHSKRTAAGVLGGLAGLIGLSVVAGVLVAATVTPAVAVSSAAATSAIDMFNNLPSVLTIDKLILPSKIYAKNAQGKETVMATYYDQNRQPVTFDQIAPVMYDAILSSEDPRFYEHGGIDPIGTARALLSNLKGSSAVQGGSSISQQYVKNVLVQQCDWNAKTDAQLNKCFTDATDNNGPGGYQRKLQEMRYSIALEQKYSKNDILLGYLNIANFGGTTYGIDAAAEHYFGVPASKLDLSQAATLAGMVQNPNTYRIDLPGGTTTNSKKQPVNGEKDHYALTKDRQEYVLGRMLVNGKITRAQYDAAMKAPITPNVKYLATGCGASSAPYFCAYVTDVVTTDPAFGKTATDRQQLLHRGGLNIYTTLDPKLQAAAQAAQNTYVPAHVDGMNFGSTSVSIQASTGRVLAMAQNTKYIAGGKAGPGEDSIIYAGSKTRGGSIGFSAGSSFKIFTLLDWLKQGHSLYQNVNGTIRTISDWKDSCVKGGVVRTSSPPTGNYNNEAGRFGTPMLFTALSLNSGYMGMASQLDLCDIGKTAESLGVTRGDGSPIPLATDGTSSNANNNPAPSEVIGSDNVSPLAMAGAYATIANKGVFCQPRVIDKVTDSSGQPLPLPQRTCTQVISPTIAATAAYAFAGVMHGQGTGAAGNPNDGTPVIGKTGTHQAWQTWLITSNTQVTTANWVGNVFGEGDLFTHWAKGNLLSNIRYPLAKSVQAEVDRLYPGGAFPPPDTTLTYGRQVYLPSVVGMSQSQAEATLTAAGFQPSVGSPVDSSLSAGTIAQQSPAAGRATSGATVTISPSTGHAAAPAPAPDNTAKPTAPPDHSKGHPGAGQGNHG